MTNQKCYRCNGSGKEWDFDDGLFSILLDWISEGPFKPCEICDGRGYFVSTPSPSV